MTDNNTTLPAGVEPALGSGFAYTDQTTGHRVHVGAADEPIGHVLVYGFGSPTVAAALTPEQREHMAQYVGQHGAVMAWPDVAAMIRSEVAGVKKVGHALSFDRGPGSGWPLRLGMIHVGLAAGTVILTCQADASVLDPRQLSALWFALLNPTWVLS